MKPIGYLVGILALSLVGCNGDTGAMGPQGLVGPIGPAGPVGPEGPTTSPQGLCGSNTFEPKVCNFAATPNTVALAADGSLTFAVQFDLSDLDGDIGLVRDTTGTVTGFAGLLVLTVIDPSFATVGTFTNDVIAPTLDNTGQPIDDTIATPPLTIAAPVAPDPPLPTGDYILLLQVFDQAGHALDASGNTVILTVEAAPTA